MTYALDTGVIIVHLNCDKSLESKMDEVVFAGNRFTVPPVVDYEIRRGLLYKSSPKKEKIYSAFSKHYGVGTMTAKMWVRASGIYVNLRRNGFTIGDDDIFIAAFCLVNGHTLVTRNTKDFTNITDLRVENWIGL